ncbi:calbindin-32-like [Panonychus citri]|uniref:calbindin-32-like n=1 Tax=Panonychus citri TaxID=50023 RepID=UPI002308149F|nr:calbindin-32-like [Panonychus citri]
MSIEGKPKNFLSQFRDGKTNELRNLTAVQFMEVWKHYDRDGNGFIEGRELDKFLREFILSINPTDEMNPELFSESTLADLKDCFMEAYDDNKDGAIEIRELAQLLPLEESFLLLFRFDNPLDSSVEFMKIWREYDTDNSGFIEADELKNFLRDLMREANRGPIDEDVDEDKLIEYTDTLLQIFDTNKDGKLQLSEMAKLLPVKENFLCRSNFIGTKLTQQDIETVFALYDRDNNGTIENEELKGFLKDLLELVKRDYDAQDLEQFQRSILKGCDLNKDGKINKKELTMVLLALAQHAQEEEESIDDKINHNLNLNHNHHPQSNHNQNGSHVNHNIRNNNNNNNNHINNNHLNKSKINDNNKIVTIKSNDKK